MRNRAMLFWSAAIAASAFVITSTTALSQKKARATVTFTVNTVADTLDANPGDGVCADANGACSLRAVIGEANALPGADSITLPSGTYTQALVAPNDDANAGGDWDITSVITITGSGEASSAVQAAPSPAMATERVLDVRSGGSLTLSHVTVRNGNFTGSMTTATRGAGIENLGELTLDNVTVRDNQITSNNGDPYGAGIYNAGRSMTLMSASITGNTISRQTGGSAYGGGIASSSETTITTTNGYIGNNNAFANGGFAYGSGIYLEDRFTVNMSGTAIANNVGSGTSGTNGGGLSAVSNVGTALFTATGCIFRQNSGSGSTGDQGVGLYLSTSGFGHTLTTNLNGTAVKDNIGASSGVGIGMTLNGGDLTLNLSNSNITNNAGGVVGGGIFVTDAGPTPSGHAIVNATNTTISNNTANGTGGGLILQGVLTGTNLNHVTFAGNTADNCGGLCTAGGVVNIKNSVVAGNTGGTTPDIAGAIVSGDYNHFENTAGATITGTTTHNATGIALLGPLVEHVGGSVNMPDPTSPVVNAIPFGLNDCGTVVVTDQRGALRPQGGACDKGAVERVVSASISGRVLTANGQGIRNAMVTLSGGNLPQPLITYTGSFGWYSFPDVPGEETYTVTATARRYEIPPGTSRSIYLFRDTSDLDFIALPGP